MPGPTPSQPGWYDDGDGHERWYDGNAWTDHVRGEAAPAPGEATNDSTVVLPVTPADGTPGTPGAPPPPPPPGLAPPGAAPGAIPGQLQVGGGKGLRIAVAVLGVVVLLAVAVVGVLVLMRNGGDDEESGKDDATPSETRTTEDAPTPSLDIPTIDPSDFPTEVPSDLASLPTVPDLPTSLPSDLLTSLPSEFPTDPSGWESWFSDYLDQDAP